MEIALTDRYMLRTQDSMNMALLELRDVKKKDGTVSTEWCPTGNYFQDAESGVRFVYSKLSRDDPYRGDLKGAVRRMSEIAASLGAR